LLWRLTDEQQLYAETLRNWLDRTATSKELREWMDASDPGVFEGRYVSDGLSGVGFGEELGGQGGGLVELALTAEAFGRSAAPSGAWLATVLAIPAFAMRRDKVARALGGATVAPCFPAEVVPDLVPLVEADGEGRVSGFVPRVLAADRAVDLLVLTKFGDAPQLRLVQTSSDGVETTSHRLLDRSRSVADVRMNSVPSEALEVDAREFLSGAAARGAVLVAADSLGAAERMLSLAREYSLLRKQFGVPIGSFQAVKHALAQMVVGVEAARSVVYFAAASVEGAADEYLLHAAAAKAQVTAEAARTADSALTVHGAIGYTWEHDLQLLYKRAKLNNQLFGAPRTWNERIASGLALF
jgi:alkylation response protein AidB-like acyl-CoA dehydrogenase